MSPRSFNLRLGCSSYGATQNGNMTTLGSVMNAQGSPQGLSFTFPTSFKSTVPMSFLTREGETFIPYDIWSQAILFFLATLPSNRGDRSEPVVMTASVKWNIPQGSKNARFRVTAVATNDTRTNTTPPTFLATIDFKVEKVE